MCGDVTGPWARRKWKLYRRVNLSSSLNCIILETIFTREQHCTRQQWKRLHSNTNPGVYLSLVTLVKEEVWGIYVHVTSHMEAALLRTTINWKARTPQKDEEGLHRLISCPCLSMYLHNQIQCCVATFLVWCITLWCTITHKSDPVPVLISEPQ